MKLLCTDHPVIAIDIKPKRRERNVPVKHLGKCHAVGAYPGHLKRAMGFYNHLDNIQTITQMSGGLSKQMANPQPLTNKEQEEAKRKGLSVHKGFVVNY